MSGKLEVQQEYLPLAVAPASGRTSRARKWLPRVAVALALLGVHSWYHCSSKHIKPFSVIPSGGPGEYSVASCADGLECGYINVPKDYFNASAGIANIAFARLKARKQPAKGSVMINPGGPGGSGVSMVTSRGDSLRLLIGDEWDLIGFDPRGIGLTRPLTKCFPNALTHQLFYANTIFQNAYDVPNLANLSDPLNKLALTEQSRQLLAMKEAQAELCHENMDVEDLKYMGTATVVRDMDFMTQVLDGKDARVNFHGFSYGTILGAYLVNMIPDRIGYAVIDGVADPIQWASEPSHTWHKNWTSSAEDTYQWFLRDCAQAGPALCALAKKTKEDPSAIQERIEKFIHSLVARPLAGVANGKPGYITSGAARGLLFTSLQRPGAQPQMARAFAEAMHDRNATLLLSFMRAAGGDLARLGVTCADSPYKPAPSAEDLADELLAGLEHTSEHFGTSPIFTEPDGGCQFWPTRGRSPGRFTGPWNASLEYPLLIISNTADPITPIASGLLINEHMAHSSRLLIQNGPGHCSLSLPSLCTVKATRAYWKGNAPKNGTWCEISTKAFPNTTEVAVNLSVEDQLLLQAAVDVDSGLWASDA